MREPPYRETVRRTLAALALCAVSAQAAFAQREFPNTLYWGSGLIDIPVAWVSPLTGDFAIAYSGKRFEIDPTRTKLNYNDRMNSQLAVSLSLLGRIEGGVAFFSSNPEYGFFARGLLVREADLAVHGGIFRFLPSIAIGARNIGPYGKIDRFGVGYELLPPTTSDPDARHEPDAVHQNFSTNGTLYGVATKSIPLTRVGSTGPDIDLSLSGGYGNGLFKDHGGLGASYAKSRTGGAFFGAKLDVVLTPQFGLSLMAENNAWDFNAGVSATYRGIRAGAFLTEIGAGSANVDPAIPATTFYNYQKFAFTLGWQSNVLALLRGDLLRNRAAALERQRARLLGEITSRQQRIASLQQEISRYEAQNLLELEQRRAAAELQLRQERDALRRLEDRLKRVEQQRGTPPPAPAPPPR